MNDVQAKYVQIRKTTTLAELVGLLAEPEKVAADTRLLWSRAEAAAAIGVSPRQFDGFRKRADFPPPVILPAAEGRSAYPRFRVSDIKAWIDAHLGAA